jgi:hypothetical protein
VQERVPVSRAELENGFHPQRVKVHPHPMLNVGGALQVALFMHRTRTNLAAKLRQK